MAKTINDYKKDYASAAARGDSAGMKAANDGANAIRDAQGVAREDASQHIGNVSAGNKGTGSTGGGSSGGSSYGSYTPGGGQGGKTTGGWDDTPDRALDSYYYGKQDQYSKLYNEARAKGDVEGMRQANDWMNQVRNDYGMAAQSANDDIQYIKGQTGYGKGGGTSYGGGAYGGVSAGGGGQPQYPFQFGSMEDMRKAMGFDRLEAQQQAAIDAYIQQVVNGLNGQKGGVNQSADEAARQAYISYERSRNVLPQALAASGYSGGMADSQKIGLETNLQNNQQEIGQNRDNALNQIETAINHARLEGSVQSAQAQAQLGRDAMSAFANYMNQANSFANSDYWNKYGYDFSAAQDMFNKNWQSGENQANRDWQSGESLAGRDWQTGENQADRNTSSQQRARDEAWNLIMSGIMPGGDLLAASGIAAGDAQSYVNEVQRQFSSKQQGKSGGGTGITGNSAYLDSLISRFNGGDHSDEVINGLISAGKPMEQLIAGGYQPNGGGIKSYSELGEAAKAIASQMGHLNSPNYPEYFAEVIQKALEGGGITEAEADFLIKSLGY